MNCLGVCILLMCLPLNIAFNQDVSVTTKNLATLELVITEMASRFHPHTNFEQFNVISVAQQVDVNVKLERQS